MDEIFPPSAPPSHVRDVRLAQVNLSSLPTSSASHPDFFSLALSPSGVHFAHPQTLVEMHFHPYSGITNHLSLSLDHKFVYRVRSVGESDVSVCIEVTPGDRIGHFTRCFETYHTSASGCSPNLAKSEEADTVARSNRRSSVTVAMPNGANDVHTAVNSNKGAEALQTPPLESPGSPASPLLRHTRLSIAAKLDGDASVTSGRRRRDSLVTDPSPFRGDSPGLGQRNEFQVGTIDDRDAASSASDSVEVNGRGQTRAEVYAMLQVCCRLETQSPPLLRPPNPHSHSHTHPRSPLVANRTSSW